MGRFDAADLYRDMAPAVLGYLRGQGLDDPEDVLGEVFLHVARDLHTFEGDAHDVRRWVFTLAHHRAVDDIRRRSRRPRTAIAELPEIAVPPAADSFNEELVAALSHLTDEQRTVVLLRFVADLSLEQVAALTGRPVGAVKTMQHRAMVQMRSLVSLERL